MVDMVNPTILGGNSNSGTDATLLALLASGNFGGGNGWGNGRNGNGGCFGNGGNVVTTTDLAAALNGQTEGQNTNAILQNLATIQQLIPENEGRVQLALAQAQIALQNTATQGQLQVAAATSLLTNNVADARHSINDNVHANGLNNANNFAGVQIGIANSTAATNSIVRETKDVAEAGFAAAQLSMAGLSLQAAQNTASIIAAVSASTAAITAQAAAINDATLNRIITNQANKIIELQGDKHVAATGLTVTQTVNQAQAQAQQQQQQQNDARDLRNILAGVVQAIHATNSNVIAGNTGAVTTGAQTANPTNVNP
jgi:hypothetical protein